MTPGDAATSLSGRQSAEDSDSSLSSRWSAVTSSAAVGGEGAAPRCLYARAVAMATREDGWDFERTCSPPLGRHWEEPGYRSSVCDSDSADSTDSDVMVDSFVSIPLAFFGASEGEPAAEASMELTSPEQRKKELSRVKPRSCSVNLSCYGSSSDNMGLNDLLASEVVKITPKVRKSRRKVGSGRSALESSLPAESSEIYPEYIFERKPSKNGASKKIIIRKDSLDTEPKVISPASKDFTSDQPGLSHDTKPESDHKTAQSCHGSPQPHITTLPHTTRTQCGSVVVWRTPHGPTVRHSGPHTTTTHVCGRIVVD